MKITLKTFLCLCLLGLFSALVEAKEWRGITPLKSTRSDVTRILGKSPDANHIRANYELEEGHIYIVFANKDTKLDCVKKLPVDTVLLIEFRPKPGMSLSNLKLDLSKYKMFNPSRPQEIGFKGYLNEDEGVIVVTFEGEVNQIDYIAALENRKMCSEYYNNPEKFVRIVAG
jgi:hypothetical protein